MIRTMYLGVLFVMIVLVFAAATVIRKREDAVSKSISSLFLVIIFAIITNAVFVMSEVEIVAVWSHSLFLASIDWLLLFMLRYSVVYTEYTNRLDVAMKLLYVIAAVETVVLGLNPFFHHVFLLEKREASGIGTFFSPVSYGFPFYIHLGFSYILVVWIFALLLYKTIKTTKVYRKKYSVILYCVAVIVIFDAIGLSLNLPIDISLLCYCLGCFAVVYFSLYYVPRSMSDTILSTAVQMADVGVGCFDVSGKCIYINQRGRQMMQRLGRFHIDEDLGEMETYFAGWLERHWNENDEEKSFVEKLTDGTREFVYEFTVQRLSDEDDELLGYFINGKDRTEEYEKYQDEHYRATHDMLTGIYNELYFEEKVVETLNKYPDTPYVMIASDIKDFKLVNDLFGVERGDEVLKLIAQMFRKYAREDDVYGHLVKDRFAFCMPKERFGADVFLRIMNEIEDVFVNEYFRLQIKMGVYEITDIQEPVFLMIDKCNLAIDRIKDVYAEQVSIYDEQLFLEQMDKNRIINEFEGALATGDITMYLQAQTTAEGKVFGAEALARWNRSKDGFLSPDEFVPVLEQAGLIWRLDMYIWELAAQQLAKWKEIGREDLHISVNISSQDQYHIDIFSVLKNIVEEYRINPKNLRLEITESIFVTEVERHLQLLKQLQEYGFEIAIDDFGSGYSSLNMLKDITANELKIDMGFLHDVKDARRSRTVVGSIISLAKELDMFVLTEGVETEHQLEMLNQMGCDAYQGFYFSKPVPVHEFEERFM